MSWDYTRDESSGFSTKIPEGRHRVRIQNAEKAVSKKGNDMLILKLDVSGYDETLYHYVVFLTDRPEITNRNLTQFYDSFKDIPDGDPNTKNWIGKVGACTIKHEEYNGAVKSRIGYFIPADKQDDMPNWREPDGREVDSDGFMQVNDADMEDLPF